MTGSTRQKRAPSPELAGGAGYTYGDTVAAYYLAALLREERAAGLLGTVRSVAVEQAGPGHPMDDIVVEFDDGGSQRTLGLQVKRKIQIGAGASNKDFGDVVARAVATRESAAFKPESDAYGFAAEYVAAGRLRSLQRLTDWAGSSPSGGDFAQRFTGDGSAAAPERTLREELAPLIGAGTADQERDFYAGFVALHLDGLSEGGILRTEVINRLQEHVERNEDGQDLLLFDRLCRLVRDGAGTARKWTREALLAGLRGAVRLRVAPSYRDDVELLRSFSLAGLGDISEEVGGFRVERRALEQSVREGLEQRRLVNLSGLPGCGKSAMLRRVATADAEKGPILLLKSDRLAGNSWAVFAATLGLRHRRAGDLLAEIGSAGTPVLFIDGIDRVRPDQKGIIVDLLRAIEENEHLAHWKVLASSRDQGLEAYRAWFPASFYRGTGVGDVAVKGFSDEEAEELATQHPNLRRLLFGPNGVREIARRPFFAAVLAQSFPDGSETPQTEVDLIGAWWDRAGHDTPEQAAPERQRALLDLAEKGARNLGKNVPARLLKDTSFAQVAGLKADRVIRDHDGGAGYSFTHDIFFEWVFFRHLIELGEDWTRALREAGEPPLLGRVVGLLAQRALAAPGRWSAGYRDLQSRSLRPQWRREWLTAPPFTSAFEQGQQEFQALLAENDHALLEKLLVWFQAQHTIPSPVVLESPMELGEGMDRVRMADLWGWPSDLQSWARLLDWLLPLAPSLPARLLPHVHEVFGVWQNACTNLSLKNPRSAAIVDLCGQWLVVAEGIEYPAEYPKAFAVREGRWKGLGGDALSNFATALRMTIIQSARIYPAPAIALFERAASSAYMRGRIYNELMGFAPTMAELAPEAVVAVAKAELMEELPRERLEREERERGEYYERLARIRAIPAKDRTEQQKRALQHVSVSVGHRDIREDDIGIHGHQHYYHPASALHEPFASLFAAKPERALGLVRDLANHATRGWQQLQGLQRRRLGTPIPVVLEFPWGRQTFWGDGRTYGWFLGEFAPNALECAFLALRYWAFKEIERGRPTDEVIRAVVEGNESYAAVGLALTLAIEAGNVSETTFPIVTCQRLWERDIARAVQAPMQNLDLLGFGFLAELSGEKAKAKAFLDSRQSRTRDVRELAMRFALSKDRGLRARFKAALARFPDELPFAIEELRTDAGVSARLRESAERWSGLGDIANYRAQPAEGGGLLVGYEPPKPMSEKEEERLRESTASLQEHNALGWATKSLNGNALAEGMSLAEAVAFARARDKGGIFTERKEAEHAGQTVISAVAAVVIWLGPAAGADLAWAWDVMARVSAMREPKGQFSGAKIPWHPGKHLILALLHDRRSAAPREDSVRRLMELTIHPLEEVAQFAFKALLIDGDEHVRWIAAQLAMELSLHRRVKIRANGTRDDRADRQARQQSVERAIKRLGEAEAMPLASVPPAWVKGRRQRRFGGEEEGWDEPDPSFDGAWAAHIFPMFPIEAWCRSALHRPMVAKALKELVTWTSERLMPSWSEDRRRRSDRTDTRLFEWNHVLGDLLARAAPFFETDFVRKEFLAPFLTQDEEGLGVLAEFADKTVTRHVLDAAVVPANTFDLLNECVERVIRDRMFNPDGYRAGQLHGFDMPKVIKSLLFVQVDQEAPGAARFVNGDWSQIGIVMPVVTRMMTGIGWSSYVMECFLKLCERAGAAYPIDAFAEQASAALGALAKARSSWAGSMLPARLAATVQRLADANYPLGRDQAQGLLRLLDALIDLGDRRSAALEQAESFRGVQALK
jgi:hypothetical protein